MLKILLDEFNLKEDGKALVLKSYTDYALRFDDIVSDMLADEQRIIIIRLPPLENYFRNLKRKFGSKVDIYSITPRSEWEKEIGFALPHEVSEQQAAVLLASEDSLKVEQRANKKLATLCVLLGITGFSDFKSQDFMQHCILINVGETFADLTSDAIGEMLTELPPDRQELWRRLTEDNNKREVLIAAIKSQIVKNYPHGSSPYKHNFKQSLNFSSFEVPSQLSKYLDDEFKNELRSYLNGQTPQNVFAMISGKLEDEWTIAIKLLRANPRQDNAVVSSLLVRALEYPDVYREIRKFKPIPPPLDVIQDNDLQDWLDKYFDFYLYSRRIEQPEYTEELANIFEGFILKHFNNLDQLFTENSILAVRQKAEKYLRDNRKLLLLVVDGLSYSYHDELKRIFGVNPLFAFSTLPTITAINKRRILSGLIDSSGSYSEIIEKLYAGYRWKETDSNKQSLNEFLKEEHDLYIYWENRFDSYIHDPMPFTKRFDDHVEILNRLSKDIDSFIYQGGMVLLTGDHGYTTLPHNESNRVKCQEGSKISHGRVLEINGNFRNDMGDGEVLVVGENYAVAKGYHYFNDLPKGATHGGATPEEMTVPFLMVERKSSDHEPMTFKLSEDADYRRRMKQVVKLIVNNPNGDDVVVTSIRFMPQVLRILSPMPVLFQRGENKMDAELDLVMVKTEQCKTFIEYQETSGKEHTTSFVIRTKGAMIEKNDTWE